jgi:hypothetical protein
VGIVADGAAFAQCFVLENEWPRLFSVALRAGLVQPSHCEASPALHRFVPVRIVALDAVHPVFNHGMVLGQIEFGVNVNMALEACARVLAWIDDELAASASRRDMKAPWTVARFAPGHRREAQIIFIQAAVRAGGKKLSDVLMAFGTRLVPGEMRSLNQRRFDRGSFERIKTRAGNQKGGHNEHGKRHRAANRDFPVHNPC